MSDLGEILDDRDRAARTLAARVGAGPSRAPAGPYRCGCNASYSQACPACDGRDAERWESAAHRRERESREVLPPCLRPGFVPENQRTGGAA